MLTAGIDHVATITKDSDWLQRFYVENFGASIEFDGLEFPGGPRVSIINIGPDCELNVFEIEGMGFDIRGGCRLPGPSP